MRFIHLLSLSVRYFKLHFKQYLFLLIAISFGFGVVTTLTSLKAGMENNLYNTSQSHYAGDIYIMGENRRIINNIDNPEMIERLIKESGITFDRTVLRTQLGEGYLYHEGAVIRQKYVIGVDWEKEKSLFEGMKYSAITENPFSEGNILISTPVAERLNVQLGDQILLEVQTRHRQVNTGAFTVSGIVEDRSIFGYFKCYLSRQDLNDLILYREEECSSIGVYLADKSSSSTAALALYDVFKNQIDTAPLVENRDGLNRELTREWEGIRYFILPLSVYISDVAELLLAIGMISYFLYVMMLLIIVVSVLVTYRLLLHEREKELGTMRAIVFTRAEIVSMLIMEMLVLFLLSVVLGSILARLVVWATSFLSFSSIASFEIFMKDGKLTAIYSVKTFLINCVIVLTSLLPAVIWPVYNASKQPLAVVLSGGSK